MNDATQKIKQELIKTCPSAQLPSGIIFDFVGDTLLLVVQNPTQNMQEDGAAFEAWSILIKMHFPNIQKVRLDVPQRFLGHSNVDLHFNRFLWRASNFESMFDWFEPGNIRQDVDDFMANVFQNIMINQPNKSRQKPQNSIGETYVEWLLVSQYKEELCRALGCDELINQFPAGLFKDSVSNANRIFNGGKSAIDIVGIERPDTLHVVELKIAKNKKMGIISELLFYTFVLKGLFGKKKSIAVEGGYSVPEFEILNGVKDAEIKGHMLAESYHPLLSQALIDELNIGLSKSNISVDRIGYERTSQDTIGAIRKL